MFRPLMNGNENSELNEKNINSLHIIQNYNLF